MLGSAQRRRISRPVLQGRITPLHLLVLAGVSVACLAGTAYLVVEGVSPDVGSPGISFACLGLVSVATLLPLSIPRNTGCVSARFIVEPIALLNSLYFALGPALSVAFIARGIPVNISPTVPLVLSLGFLTLHLGIRAARGLRSKAREQGYAKCAALAPTLVSSVVLLWILRLALLVQGLGITHGPSIAAYSRDLATDAVATSALGFVPLSLCLARLCRSSEQTRDTPLWRAALMGVVGSDCLYYLVLGWRLYLLWELVIVFWAWRSRPGCVPRRLIVGAALAIVVAIPLVYAQRAVLGTMDLTTHENQVEFIAGKLAPAEQGLGSERIMEETRQGFIGDAVGRWNAVQWFSEVAYQHFDSGYNLLLGSSWRYGLPFMIPRWLWPGKPVQENIDAIIDHHFGLFPTDELTTTETEMFANFGVFGLWAWMFVYGIIAGKVALTLAAPPPLRESTLFLAFCTMPVIFLVETDTVGILAALRLPLILWLALTVFERQREIDVAPLQPQGNLIAREA